MSTVKFPSLDEFLAAPIEEIAKVAPETMIFNAGGTRRRALLAGISPTSKEYPQWSRQQMINALNLLFEHGVQHVFTSVLAQNNFAETTPSYREQLVNWVIEGLSGEAALEDYRRLGLQARVIGADSIPGLEFLSTRLIEKASRPNAPTIWFSISTTMEAPWEAMFQTLHEKGATTRQELIKHLYKEDIPLVTLFLGNGKPQLNPGMIPPLLMGQVHYYWRQHLGYDLDSHTFRHILYDYAYLRRTWTSDKSGRAEQIEKFSHYWESPPVLGLGQRLGPFWYPLTDAVGSGEDNSSS